MVIGKKKRQQTASDNEVSMQEASAALEEQVRDPSSSSESVITSGKKGFKLPSKAIIGVVVAVVVLGGAGIAFVKFGGDILKKGPGFLASLQKKDSQVPNLTLPPKPTSQQPKKPSQPEDKPSSPSGSESSTTKLSLPSPSTSSSTSGQPGGGTSPTGGAKPPVIGSPPVGEHQSQGTSSGPGQTPLGAGSGSVPPGGAQLAMGGGSQPSPVARPGAPTVGGGDFRVTSPSTPGGPGGLGSSSTAPSFSMPASVFSRPPLQQFQSSGVSTFQSQGGSVGSVSIPQLSAGHSQVTSSDSGAMSSFSPSSANLSGSEKQVLEALRREQYKILQALQEQLRDLSIRMMASSNEISNLLSEVSKKGQAGMESWMAIEENKKALEMYKTFVETEKSIISSRLGIVGDIVKVMKDVNEVFQGQTTPQEALLRAGSRSSGEDSLVDVLRQINQERIRMSGVGEDSSSGQSSQVRKSPSQQPSQASTIVPSSPPGLRVAMITNDSVTFTDGSTLRVGERYQGMTVKKINFKGKSVLLCPDGADGKKVKCTTIN